MLGHLPRPNQTLQVPPKPKQVPPDDRRPQTLAELLQKRLHDMREKGNLDDDNDGTDEIEDDMDEDDDDEYEVDDDEWKELIVN